jgi:hypothetical protein
MSIQYFHYTFADETARAITFFNGVTSNLSERPDNFHATDKYYQGDYLPLDQYTGIEVRAAYKIAGDPQWKTADWTLDQRTAFCRDKADERLEELVIILVNGERDQFILHLQCAGGWPPPRCLKQRLLAVQRHASGHQRRR